jgi:autotransporter adhesin
MKTGKRKIAAMVTAVLLSTGFAVIPMQSTYATESTSNTNYGLHSIATGKSSTAIGENAKAEPKGTKNTAVALGSNVQAINDWTTAVGGKTIASGHAATAIGAHTTASGDRSIAIGDTVHATAAYTIAMGAGSNAAEANSIALGASAKADKANSVALGTSSVTGDVHTGTTAKSVTLGDTTTTFAGQASTAKGSVSVGKAGAERQVQNVAAGDISATSTDAINGSQLYATNEQVEKNVTNIKTNAANIQKNADNIQTNADNIKTNADNIQNNTTNINNLTETVNTGWEADVNGEKVKSVTPSDNKLNFQEGKNITITGSGSDITVATKDDVTFSTVKVGDTVSISKDGIDNGGQKITNVQDGTVSADSKDAVNGSQLYGVQQHVDAIGDNITNMGNKLHNLDNRVDKVGAGAAALAALHPLDFDPDDKWDFAAGYGHYNGRNAYALGLFYRPNEDTMFSVGSTLGNGENLLNAGLSLKFGQGNHVSTTRVAMAKEILDLRADNKAMHSQINAMNARLNTVMGMLDMAKSASFPDVAENHWAYEAVAKLAGNGIIKGYPDGTFQGDRTMTRYEFATMLYRAMGNGAVIDGRLLKEFKPELDRIRVDAVNQHIDRVRVNAKGDKR